MTLPAESLPDLEAVAPPIAPEPAADASPDTGTRAARPGLSSPAAFVSVVAVSALVLIGCVLGATLSGLFGILPSPPESAATPAATWIDPSRQAVASFDDGQYLVAKDIQAGTYATTVPAGSPGCSWERNASTDGTAVSVLDSGGGPEGTRLVVTIKATDVVFQSIGCGRWLRIGD